MLQKTKYLILFFILVLLYPIVGYTQTLKRPTIALVLSGGGAKGFAHIGVLKVLEEEGIPIDIIVGTSMGGIVGGLYAIGYNASEIEQMSKSENWGQLLSDEVPRDQLSQHMKTEKQRFILSVPLYDQKKPTVPHGAIKGQNIINLFCNLSGKVPENTDFKDFPINFACIGTNLETGKQIIIDKGFFPTALYSTMAIPGVFLPGEHDGHTMIDGGVVNNFPTDVAKAMGADIIIGVDLRNDLHSSADIRSINHLMDQLINFYSIEKDSINKSFCTVLIRPDISGYGASSFSSRAVDTLVNRGILAAQIVLPEIRELKAKYNLTPYHVSRNYVKDEKWQITDITVSGHHAINEKLILDNMGLITPGDYTYNDIKQSIDRVYGLGCIKRAYFNLVDNDKGKTLNLTIDEEGVSNLNVGMRLNTTEAVSILLNYTQKDFRRYIGSYSLTADISSNPGFNIFGEISKGNLPIIGLQLDGRYRNFNVYSNGEKSSSADIYYGAVSIYGYKPLKKRAIAGLGIREEFFIGNFYTSDLSDSIIVSPSSKTSISSIYTYFSYDNLDNFYFPSKGTELYLEGSILEDEEFNNISPVALIKMRNIIKLNSKYNILLNFYGRAIFSQSAPSLKLNYVGGFDHEIYFNNHLPFFGIPSLMLSEQYSFIGATGLRVNIVKKQYISVIGNCLVHNTDLFDFVNYKLIWGLGMRYSYNSIIGPIDLTLGYSDWYSLPSFAANIGFWF